ncbi:hypothetical protein CAC42_1353 [Sphaceloma murrayae]|uniref:Apc15p protein-domain-containing protein n=1 Tax=Sphaceloma murrayae TaxID=2082308 RepID=A0A2K1QG69_9PEZI|nr:hypothetical protein CAC42_1353 [Sphaceloma murrayae]
MFALPLITPLHDFALYLPHTDPQPPSDPSDPPTAAAQAQRRQQPTTNPFSPLALLKADEDAIRKRKENIARFGSTWIKPPGISKTLQAETEERAEREEQELLARREQMMLDMQARQEEEERRARVAAEGEGEETGRDLDDEVPDAEEVEDLDDDDDDDESESEVESEEDDGDGMDRDLDADVQDGSAMDRDLDGSVPEGMESTEGDMTFGDGSLIEGSMFVDSRVGEDENGMVAREIEEQERYARIEEAELTGAAQEQYDLGMEGNLDDSVPDAGAYEHTDTELEDDSSEDEDSLMGPPVRPEAPRRTSGRAGLFDISRRALGSRPSGGRPSGGSTGSRSSLSARDASSLLESSFVTSSPVVGRGLRSNRGRSR